jgi:hypothetical protein
MPKKNQKSGLGSGPLNIVKPKDAVETNNGPSFLDNNIETIKAQSNMLTIMRGRIDKNRLAEQVSQSEAIKALDKPVPSPRIQPKSPRFKKSQLSKKAS